VQRAEAVLREWDARSEAVCADLRQAVNDWGEVSGVETHISILRGIEGRLAAGLGAARRVGLSEAEMREAEFCRRRVHNRIEDMKGQVRVYCRVRPLNEREIGEGDVPAVRAIDGMTLEVPSGVFNFDSLYTPSSQEQVFEDCRDLVQSTMDGHNVTIFAYGQTGAGKTHTMYGNPQQEGIAPRAINELFRLAETMQGRHSVRVTASMVELYNNTLIDLLRPVGRTARGDASPKLSLVRDHAGVVQIENISEKEASNAAELKALLQRGLSHRTVAANTMNIESSRSHLIFTIRATSRNRLTGEICSGKLLLCDLGGSERLKKSEACGHQRKEAIEINKSLSALGDVVEAVARRQKQVPYRNHKLTQIMQDSIGGTAKTLMFVNCSPARRNLSETTMSLMYAARVKRITNAGSPSCLPSSCGASPVSPTRRTLGSTASSASPFGFSPARSA